MHPIKYPANSNIHEIARKEQEAQSLSQQMKDFYARKLQEAFDCNDETVIKQVCAILNQRILDQQKMVAIATKCKKGV